MSTISTDIFKTVRGVRLAFVLALLPLTACESTFKPAPRPNPTLEAVENAVRPDMDKLAWALVEQDLPNSTVHGANLIRKLDAILPRKTGEQK